MLSTQLVALPIWDIELHVRKPIRGYPLDSDVSLGACLKRERIRKGWTQEKTAKFLRLMLPNYSRLEWNNHVPHVKRRRKINEFLQYNYWDDGTESLANRLLLYRIEHKLSTVECGAIIGVSWNTIKRIETKIKVSTTSINHIESQLLHQ